ncbi:hypothetical protein [Yersinia enterocolitica]|uniref:hypothetical protein n=1 Tax=Yersinia enterocolitica TaxID=630 RepID=UPI003D00C08E
MQRWLTLEGGGTVTARLWTPVLKHHLMKQRRVLLHARKSFCASAPARPQCWAVLIVWGKNEGHLSRIVR